MILLTFKVNFQDIIDHVLTFSYSLLVVILFYSFIFWRKIFLEKFIFNIWKFYPFKGSIMGLSSFEAVFKSLTCSKSNNDPKCIFDKHRVLKEQTDVYSTMLIWMYYILFHKKSSNYLKLLSFILLCFDFLRKVGKPTLSKFLEKSSIKTPKVYLFPKSCRSFQ